MPFNLTFNSPVPGSINDKTGGGTGFTTVNNYSGTRLPADGIPSNLAVPGYEASKIALSNGRIQITTNKGIDYQGNNNQLNVLGVKITRFGKLQIDVKVINPYNGTSSQQAGIWYGLNDKTFIKLDINGNKVELRKELNDITSAAAGNANPDQRVTGTISGLNTKTVTLRLIIDSAAHTAEGFYSRDGIQFISTGASYTTKYLNISGMGLTGNETYAGIFASHRNATAPVTYSFDDFNIADLVPAFKALAFSQKTLSFTALKGAAVIAQQVIVIPNQGHPVVSLSNSNANWLTLPSAANDTLVFNQDAINTTISAGNYQSVIVSSAPGYRSDTLLVNLTVIDALQPAIVKINFQDAQTVPPPGYIRDFGQVYGMHSGLNQMSGYEFGWKKRSDGTVLNLTANGRNRSVPEDLLLATFMHMQANNISGSFTGLKTEGYWEMKVPNGTYDVTASVGDGTVGTAPEAHSINIEGVNAINRFVPSGKQGSIGRFKAATQRISVNDEHLTINADGGTNTKINFAGIEPVSLSAYLYWSNPGRNLIIKKGTAATASFTNVLGSSNNLASSYSLGVSYAAGASGWLNFTTLKTGAQPLVSFDYSAAKSLPVGTYNAVITATSQRYTSASFPVQINVVDTLRPYVISSTPANDERKVSLATVSFAANNLHVPAVAGYQGGVDNSTITNTSVKLLQQADTSFTPVTGVVQGTGGGDAISFSPSSALLPNTTYKFVVTANVKSYSGAAFNPYEATFTTDAAKIDSANILNAQFVKVAVAGTQGKKYCSLTIGPDGNLYALRLDGVIERFSINHTDGTLTLNKTIRTLVNKYGNRSAIGITFDPMSTAANPVAWVSHSSAGLTTAPAFDGNISRLEGDSLQTEQLIITKLPRSTRDHMVNSLAFGPDHALYICQGSNSSAGLYDSDWQRNESLLSGAVLRLDLVKLGGLTLPLNVQTTTSQALINNAPAVSATMSDGTYNPYGSLSPLTIYASGVRNAYDLVWHSNGQLYLPANGSGGGGNSPASVNGTRRPNGTFYNGPAVPATTGVQVQDDWLFRVNPDFAVGYYGHPNPLRGEYVINRGYADNPLYSPAVVPDSNYRAAYNFGLNNSPDGAIEYKSNTFNGALKGRLLVCRFSGGGDIIVMQPGSITKTSYTGNNDHIYDVVKVNTGSSNSGLVGMSGFANPLDLVEDTLSGNLYVIEYNWNDNPNLTAQITLLRASANAQPQPMLTLSAVPLPKVNAYTDQVYEVTLSNRGDGVSNVNDIGLTGADASRFKISGIPMPDNTHPLTLKKNGALSFKVSSPSTLNGSFKTHLRVTSREDTTKEVLIENQVRVDTSPGKKDYELEADQRNADSHTLQVYPNPNTDGRIYVRLRNFKPREAFSLYLYSIQGASIETIRTIVNEAGEFNTAFKSLSTTYNKFYLVRVEYLSGYKYAKVFVGSGY
ncbi:Ig-like domain-containing protein [Mucilaginibacter celer]|uniref:Ig-like domain-containing protein n=1 Tax=Mucilaginibacter celer TaxID=2305508 RepID=UPI0013CE8F72|nr:Ig-like domain-containing protein [Mucilaginibacter celer]